MAKTFFVGHLQAGLCDPLVDAVHLLLGNQQHASKGIERRLNSNKVLIFVFKIRARCHVISQVIELFKKIE
jgi:hypothetical protein